jgi:hypothetical protein
MSNDHKQNCNYSPGPSVPEDAQDVQIPGTQEDVQVTVMNITPEMASEWLEHNTQNRSVREDRVDRYAEQMRDGEWLVSPDAISFDYNGRLINGQHRLKAIQQLSQGTEVQCMVAFGLQPAAFKIADVGVKRTGGDVLRIEGFKNPEELAATCRLLAMWKQGRLEEAGRYENVRNSVIVEVANRGGERLAGTVEKVTSGEDKRELVGFVPRSIVAFAYFAYKESFPTRTDYFYDGLLFSENFPAMDWEAETGTDGAKNPISLFRSKMINNADYNRARTLGYLIKALNAYCLKRPLKRLRYRKSDNFPSIKADMASELEGDPGFDPDMR